MDWNGPHTHRIPGPGIALGLPWSALGIRDLYPSSSFYDLRLPAKEYYICLAIVTVSLVLLTTTTALFQYEVAV